VHQVAAAKPAANSARAGAPVVARAAIRFVDRARRSEDARHGGPAHQRREAAEGVAGAAGRCRSSSSCLRVTGSRASAAREVHLAGVDAGQDLAKAAVRTAACATCAGSAASSCGLAVRRRARLQVVEVFAHGHG
jgi:hypothetical protein